MNAPMTLKPGEKPSGWIIYDGGCGICSRLMGRFQKILRRRKFAIVPSQSEWVRKKLDLDDLRMPEDFRIMLAKGDLIVGADAYRYLLRRIWWAYPLYLLSRAPVGKAIFDLFYRYIADHRYMISRRCVPGEFQRSSPITNSRHRE